MSDRRLEDLEIKVAFVENTVAELDSVLRRMADELESMRTDLKELRESLPNDTPFNPDEEVPPHY